MRIEEYEKLLTTMTEEELNELIRDIRRNRTTMTESRVKAVRERTKSKNMKSIVSDMTDEEKKVFKQQLINDGIIQV